MALPNTNVVPLLTGPVDLWAKAGSDSVFTQVGYSEQGFRIEFDQQYIDLFSDRRGPTRPFKRLNGGKAAFIVGTLTEWDFALAQRLLDTPDYTAGSAAGTDARLDIGKDMTGLLQLKLRCQFYGTTAASTGSPQGWWFYNCYVGPHALDPLGTRAPKLSVTFEADMIFDTALCTWKLYSTTASDFSDLAAPCTAD